MMKGYGIYMVMVILSLMACSKEEDLSENKAKIPFDGHWQRMFEAGAGNPHIVDYIIYQDSIHYSIAGTFGNASYTMVRDTFIVDDNRFIGHTNEGEIYLVFVKDATDQEITLYKEKLENMDDGLNSDVPPSNTTANHGWNTYLKIQ